MLFYGLPIDELQNFRERVNAVTVDDIQRVAQAVSEARPSVGRARRQRAAFTTQLQGLGFGRFETVDIQNLDLTAVDFKRPVRRAQSDVGRVFQRRRDAERETPAARSGFAYAAQSAVGPNAAHALLARVINAMGGLATLRGVKTIVARQTVTSPTPQGAADAETTSYIEYPNKFRVEANTPAGMLASGYDGIAAWTRDPRGVRSAPPETAAEARSNLKRDVIRLLLDAQDNQLSIRVLQDVRGADGRSQHVLEFTGSDQNPIVLNVDAETFKVTRESYAAGGGQALVDETFSDYRAVDGVQMPFAAERRVGPLSIKRRVTDLQINRPIDPLLFARPAS